MSDRSFITTFLRMGGCLLLGGCAYHAGYPVDQYGIKTIYVKPAVKEAIGTQLSGVLTAQIREEILRNGFIRITDQKETADAILETTITDYNRGISVTDEDDDEKAKSLSLSATVKYKLTDNHTGQTISDGSASGSVSINATTNAQAIEYQRTPQLTRTIAKKIAQHIVLKEKPKETKKEGEVDSKETEDTLPSTNENTDESDQNPHSTSLNLYRQPTFPAHPTWKMNPMYLTPPSDPLFLLRSVPIKQQPFLIIPKNSLHEKSLIPISNKLKPLTIVNEVHE